jgi:polyhydroxyalkanoate synthesis regulator phasin
METEMIILYATILAGLALGAYKTYKRLMADGKITLDEVLELAEDLKEISKTLPSAKELKKMKKAELLSLCEENGLDTKGVKADLIARLEELE